MKYELLFKPLQVRSLILKNRIACAPMTGPGEGQPSIKPSALEYGGSACLTALLVALLCSTGD